MKFGSWTYDGSAIDLQLKMDGGDTSNFIANGEWDLIGQSHVTMTSVVLAMCRRIHYGVLEDRIAISS